MAIFQRRKTHTANVGGVRIGSDAPIAVQSMTNTDTADIPGTNPAGDSPGSRRSELVRVTVNNDDARRLSHTFAKAWKSSAFTCP